ncbi:MAG: dihydropyrimidinase, partial [Gemmatimonadota bacterium]|nr:dihydropyrimidinase [Gemmatimonadota bacterium]
ERIALLGRDLDMDADETIDATGKYVFPGGIDMHTHLDMPFFATATSDDFHTGTAAACAGGTTSVIDFAIQAKGESLASTLETWKAKAKGKAVGDYGFHMAVTDLTDAVLAEIPEMVALGVPSMKLFLAYKGALMVSDEDFFRTLVTAGENGALVMVHAENGDVIDHLQRKFLSEGKTEPRYHALSRPPAIEGEATGRAIALAEVAGAPLYVVHVTCREAVERIREAQDRGLPVHGETCPQYLYLSYENYLEPGFEGAKYVMSPPLRDASNQAVLWKALGDGTLEILSSDHAPFRMADQKILGKDDFSKIPNGAGGIESRLYLLWTGGVEEGRISRKKFVDLVSAAPARRFGLYPRKGVIAPGSDADLVVWDPTVEHVLSAEAHHMAVDFNPFEGIRVKGRPEWVFRRGETVGRSGNPVGEAGSGEFLPR